MHLISDYKHGGGQTEATIREKVFNKVKIVPIIRKDKLIFPIFVFVAVFIKHKKGLLN